MRRRRDEYIRRTIDLIERNGIINDNSTWEGEACWDRCTRKGWCEAGAGGVCDWENYCHPANDDSTAQEIGVDKQYCNPPQRAGRRKRKTKKRKTRRRRKRKSR